MNLLARFYVLKTASSEVNRRTLFKHRLTTFVPDMFFVFCFGSTLFAAQLFDKVFAILMFFWGRSLIVASVFATFTFVPFACFFWIERSQENCIPGYKMRTWCSTIFILFGFGPLLICGNVLKNTFKGGNEVNIPLKYHSIPMFHINNKNMSLMKMYCMFYVALKCIPQFYIVSILIMERYLTGTLAILGQVSILLNMIVFALTMAVTFPLRPTPRIFTTSCCIVFNAFCKFMATLCGCCINLAIFTMLFSKIGYYALLINATRSLLWIWPSWWVLKTQPHSLDKCYFSLYLFFLTLIFSFIYIHPFEGRGKLIYYFFYLSKLLSEIFCIYVLTDVGKGSIRIYFTIKAVMMGFISCYGLVNILHKYKSSKFGCEVDIKKETDSSKQRNMEGQVETQADLEKPGVSKLKNEGEDGQTGHIQQEPANTES